MIEMRKVLEERPLERAHKFKMKRLEERIKVSEHDIEYLRERMAAEADAELRKRWLEEIERNQTRIEQMKKRHDDLLKNIKKERRV